MSQQDEQRPMDSELIKRLDAIVGEIYREWDAAHDARVGKLLAALSGRLQGYRADITEFRAALERSEAGRVQGLERFLGLTREELEADDIAFLREGDTLAQLRTHHPAGIVRALCAMVLTHQPNTEVPHER